MCLIRNVASVVIPLVFGKYDRILTHTTLAGISFKPVQWGYSRVLVTHSRPMEGPRATGRKYQDRHGFLWPPEHLLSELRL